MGPIVLGHGKRGWIGLANVWVPDLAPGEAKHGITHRLIVAQVRADAGERGAQVVDGAGQFLTPEPNPRLPKAEHQGRDITLS